MKPHELKLSHEYLLEILEYFPDTGIFIWKVKFSRKICIGKEAGCKNKSHGRYQIKINKNKYYRSRLAWFYVHGKWPSDQIDHKNRIRDDDRIKNLREATNQENMWNTIRSIKKDNLPKCIYYSGNKFQVQLRHKNKKKYLGTFSNLDDAIKARDAFEIEHRKFLKLSKCSH